jgi:hypothetical protein
MSEVNSNAEVVTVDETEVAREATRLINTAAAKHGLATSEIPQDVVDRAHAEARALLESREKHKSDPYYAMYLESQERLKTTEAQLAAVRTTRVQSNEHVIVETMDRARRRIEASDPHGWVKMSPEQRLASIGVDFRTIDKVELAQLFGKNSDHKRASDLHRADQRKYKTLKEAAKILGLY